MRPVAGSQAGSVVAAGLVDTAEAAPPVAVPRADPDPPAPVCAPFAPAAPAAPPPAAAAPPGPPDPVSPAATWPLDTLVDPSFFGLPGRSATTRTVAATARMNGRYSFRPE